jgi:hypothetical protein
MTVLWKMQVLWAVTLCHVIPDVGLLEPLQSFETWGATDNSTASKLGDFNL